MKFNFIFNTIFFQEIFINIPKKAFFQNKRKYSNNYERNSAKFINNISFNNYITYSEKDEFNPNFTENNNYKKKNFLIQDILYRNNNFENFEENECSYNDKNYSTSLINCLENENPNNYKKRRKIYPKIYKKDLGNNNQNFYLKRNNLYERRNKENIKFDYDNYLQNKRLFFIYRAKLFKLLHKKLSIIVKKYFISLKFFAFQKIKNFCKQDDNYLLLKIKNNINKIYQKRNENYFFDKYNTYNKSKKKNNNYSIYSYFNNKINNKISEDNILNNSISSSKSCANFIKKKNESESKEKRGNSELYRNRNYLIEKYEEIRKRKNIKEKEMNNNDLKNKKKL